MLCPLISDLIGGEVEYSECLYEVESSWVREKEQERDKERERRDAFVLRCCAVMHHSDVVPLDLRFDWRRGRV